jgi:protoporphyrinogen oxidase
VIAAAAGATAPAAAADAAETVIAGGGPAGLTAARELVRLGRPAVVYERDDVVGGISRTVEYRGYRFDVGGHRFFTKVPEVRRVWHELLAGELLVRPRLSRLYYRGRFFDYPLKPLRALRGLGPVEAARVLTSYLAARLAPARDERSFEGWVCNRFGRRLYEIFFKTYTEKVWGIPCREIDSTWAAQRIRNLDLARALWSTVRPARRRGGEIASLIERFHYPRLGPGQMWERCRDELAEAGVETRLGHRVAAVHLEGDRVAAVSVEDSAGRRVRRPLAHLVSTMPLPELVAMLDPPPPPRVAAAARRLRFRDFLTVVLVVDRADVFPDNWIYVHAPEVAVGRIQNFKNWSPAMVPDAARTALGLEYFVQQGDEAWEAPDGELIERGKRELAALGLARPEEVVDGTVVRMPKAYPVYDGGYREALGVVRGHLDGIRNLHPVGRNGQHRYNNQDHSMLTGMYAARNIAGAGRHDLWSVNVEDEYHEEGGAAWGDRPVPERLPAADVERLLGEAFARYHPVALGSAVGAVAAAGLFAATALLLVRGGDPLGPNLSLVANYLLGYEVSWPGAALGAAEAAAGGYLFGDLLARAVNAVVGWSEAALRRRLELEGLLDPITGGAR